MKKYLILMFCLLISQNENFIIDEISVEGNIRMSDENIKFIAGLEEGMYINNFNIQNSIKKLWSSNVYLDIRMDIEKGYLSNKLIIYVEEAPFINQIIFKGNKKISDKKLLEKLSVNEGDLLNYNNIKEGITSIIDYYKEKKFHNVKISYELEQNSLSPDLLKNTSKDIVISVNEGNKIRLKNIVFNGNDSFSDNTLIKQFQDSKPWRWYRPFKGDFNEEKYEIDKMILEDFYFNKGYKNFQIKSDSISYGNNEINIYIDLAEGDPHFIREISWDGNILKSDSTLIEVSQLNSGDLYNKKILNQQAIESVRTLYMNEGFLNFNIESVVRPVASEQNMLDIQFIINENEVFSINNIIITGNKKTHENVIRRELNIFPGEKFNRNKLYESMTDLWMLNFFSDVVPRVIPTSNDQIDLEIEVSEKNIGTANFSMGYNQIHGFQGGGGFEFPNFRGKGQTLSITYQRGLSGGNSLNDQNLYNNYSTSNVNQYESFSISYFDPSLFDTPNSIGVSLSHSERGQNQNSYWPFDTDNSRLSFRFGRRKLKWPDRYFRIMWSYTYSQDRSFANTIEDLTSYWGSSVEPYIDYSNNSYVFKTSGVSISQIITRDSRNRPEFPTQGSKIKLTSSLSGSFLGGNHDYTKNTFELNTFKPLREDYVVSQMFKIGGLTPIDMPENQRSVVPISARYFMGGSGMSYGETLRGYPENSIGPYDYRPRGGNLMLKYSLEFRMLFSSDPTVFGFLFADMGNVWSDYDVIKLTDLKRSVGIGVRLYMPMLGILGYDIGYGFDKTILDSGSSHGFEHHFVFGMPLN